MTELQAPQPGEFLLYETEDGRTRVECRFAEDTISAVIVKQIKAVRPHLIVLIQLIVGITILFPFADLQSATKITNVRWGYLLILGAVHSCLTYMLMYSCTHLIGIFRHRPLQS